MIAALFLLAFVIVFVAAELRVRHARHQGYTLAIEHARAAALSIAEGCRQGDGMDNYEIGRHSGAMDTFNAISYLLVIDRDNRRVKRGEGRAKTP
jgi:hypothetical protein